MKQDVVISQNLQEDLQQAINRCSHDKLFVLTDNTTLRLHSLLFGKPCSGEAPHATACSSVWEAEW